MIKELKAAITTEIRAIPLVMLKGIPDNFIEHLHQCHATYSGYLNNN